MFSVRTALVAFVALSIAFAGDIASAHGGRAFVRRNAVVVNAPAAQVVVNRGFFGRQRVVVSPFFRSQSVFIRQPALFVPRQQVFIQQPFVRQQVILQQGGCSGFFCR